MIEFFVHHEDVRRANGDGPRTDRPDLQDDVWSLLSKMAPLMVRKAGITDLRITLSRADDDDERTVGKGPDEVRLTADPGELVLELYGRHVAEVAYDGPPAAVERVRAAEFGI